MKKEREGEWGGDWAILFARKKKIRSICEKFVIFKIY